MASTLPSQALACCTPDCEEPVSVAVPGPEGDDGTNGTNGAAGVTAFTTFTAAFTMPAEGASSVATVGTSAPFAVNQILYAAKIDGSVRGYLQVTAIGGATSITLQNIEVTATGAYSDNSAPGSIFTIGSQLQPGGTQGPNGLGGSTVIAGDVTGTLAASELTLNSALGALPVGNGLKAISLAKGTDGQILVSDAAAALDLQWKGLLPITGGTNVADNALLRLDTATGLPIPAQASPMVLTDNGALQATYGNAKGADAVDLQASHNAVTQVASGQESVIAGGRRNTAAGLRSTISGGDTNTINASAQEGTIAGGTGNSIGATGIQAFIGGGDTNSAVGEESVIGGGDTNSTSAAAANSTIGGGRNKAD